MPPISTNTTATIPIAAMMALRIFVMASSRPATSSPSQPEATLTSSGTFVLPQIVSSFAKQNGEAVNDKLMLKAQIVRAMVLSSFFMDLL